MLEPFPRQRARLLENSDVALSLAMPTRSDLAYFANADGDELYYVHSGSGTLRTLLGDLSYRAGDYVYVPRALLHRFVLDNGVAQHWLVIELRQTARLARQLPQRRRPIADGRALRPPRLSRTRIGATQRRKIARLLAHERRHPCKNTNSRRHR